MPRFEPFPGLRYDPDHVGLDRVVAPPYDVISPDEAAALRARSPYNSVRIELPDAAPGLDPYQAAARRVADWQSEGVLRRDAPSLYGYRMSYVDPAGRRRRTVGVIGALALEPPGTGGIFPHERTTPKAKSDRLQLLQSTKLNTSPIWGLSLAKGLTGEIPPPPAGPAGPADATGLPSADRAEAAGVVDEEGVRHEAWPITDDDTIARISDAIAAAPVVIADGHHRFETALTYQRSRRAGDGDGDAGFEAAASSSGTRRAGAADAVMALIVELVDDQLSVQGIHRLISGLGDDVDIPEFFGGYFELIPTAPPDATIVDRMADAGALALITPTGNWLLRPTPATDAAAGHDLDSSRLEVALAELPPHELVYQHGGDRAAGAVARGDAQAAVLLRPVTVEQIAATGQGGERMPPKTTFFWPKPRTGFVFREVPD